MKKLSAGHTKYSGNLKKYWRWSIILAFTLLILDGVLLIRDRMCGLIGLVFTAVYLAVIFIIYAWFRPRIMQELVRFATGYGQIQSQILQEFELPMALLEADGRVLFLNDRMCTLTERKSSFRKNISMLFPEINRGTIPVTGFERDVLCNYQEKEFRAHLQRIPVTEILTENSPIELENGAENLYILYLFDETELNRYIVQNRDQKGVVGLVYIDNYEETMDRIDEVRQSLLNVMVERRVSKYFDSVGGLLKKLEKDKYLLIMDRKGLDTLIADHFSILESVKTINIGNEINITLSIGVGTEGKNNQANYTYARGAMEMALGRGGDQAVVKNGEEMTFFGGKTQLGERQARVKSRMKAQAMRELILSMDNVITMGHSMTDMDSLGAAVGVCRAARTVGKRAHIVLGEINSNIRSWVNAFRENKDFDDDMFITHEQAMNIADENTAVIIVDTNRAARAECPELLEHAGAVAVLDHHRQTVDTLEHAALSYIEPSASSACEMISEILQYFEENVYLSSLEADCIYAGIIIDTDNFLAKTGVRTFEAAAYLRRCGADVIRVRKALRESFDNYIAKAEAVSNAEKYMDSYAISTVRQTAIENPSVVGAQAANELLDIIGVKASFVLTECDNRIFISARSIDEANVQLVMERLGGGGHLNMAGAQLTGVTLEQAVLRVKEVLRVMTEEKAI